jgi:molybdate transport system substrate-binding protein
LLVVALLGLSACSDAHSEAQQSLGNQGYDPAALVILAPSTLSTTLSDLGTEYTKLHPDVSFILVSDVVAALVRVAKHYHRRPGIALNPKQALNTEPVPELWVDTSNSLRTLLPPGTTVYGEPKAFGVDRLTIVVPRGNPNHITGLGAFAAGSGVRTGMCLAGTACGSMSKAALQERHITAKPVVGESTGKDLVADLLKGRIQAILMSRVDAATAMAKGAPITLLPIQPAPSKALSYSSAILAPSPIAAKFATWVNSSPEAARILAFHGFTPPVASTS